MKTTIKIEPSFRQALRVAVQLVAQRKIDGTVSQRRDAIDQVLKLLEIGCDQGFSIGGLTVAPGTTLDGRLVIDIMAAVDSRLATSPDSQKTA
ncbi:hypothetical protein [Litorivicinus lipolyticus]|jgi:hypothetical protein|uniref:hypothetical protein n=1 Tax=Litorivicinus lipolyticus TaxID=418701 RepID=UPI003B5C6802